MSTFNHLLDLQPEQICYVHCGFCTTVLLVIVPHSCLSTVVTVKCGHCTSLLSVNLMRSSVLPLHFFSSVHNQQEPMVEACEEEDHEELPKLTLSKHSSSSLTSSEDDDDDDDDEDREVVVNHVVNKPPEKRQRAPSTYNQFIKDEIRRLKTQHPNMSHKQVFSAAAKNWAHSPHILQQNDQEDKSKDLGGESTVMVQELGLDARMPAAGHRVME